MESIGDGQSCVPLGIHDVDIGHIHESMFLGHAKMVGRIHSVASIGCVAFNECAIDHLNEILDKCRVEMV